ncbi:MAG: copper-binding protein [Methylophilus sp.]|nr:copper-binding protein [Methylophilus sp.]
MKLIVTLSLILVLSTSSLAIAQSGGMKDMDMQDMDMKQCMEMKGMKDMDMSKCKDMKDMEMGKKVQGTAPKVMTHKATGVVKAVDSSKGTVTLAHGPVKSLKWPAMTMSFAVKDKTLFDNLIVGKKVKVEFIKQDTDYIVTSVK